MNESPDIGESVTAFLGLEKELQEIARKTWKAGYDFGVARCAAIAPEPPESREAGMYLGVLVGYTAEEAWEAAVNAYRRAIESGEDYEQNN